MPNKVTTVRIVRPNAGIQLAYKRKLQAMIERMAAAVERAIVAEYKRSPPRVAELAQDAAPSVVMQSVIGKIAKKWLGKFDESAEKIAEAYVKDSYKATDSAFRAALKDAGWAVEFKMTPAMRDALEASIAENVGLIRSIPNQYLQKVEGAVMRSYAAGRDLETMVKDIRAIYPVTKRRAEFIARDQSNKANAIVNRTRSLELGITEAIWMHSHAGKHPRPDHVKADGTRYNIAEGCLISGEYIQPGEEPGCRCGSRVVLPFNPD